MPIRDTLDSGDANRLGAVQAEIGLGSLVNDLVLAMTATEAGVTVTSNVATLANAPKCLLHVNVTAGTTTGVKAVKKGPITGPNALTPATGECVWDGNKSVKFATADAATAASFWYTRPGTTTISYFRRELGQADTP